MDRREFLKTVGTAGVVLSGAGGALASGEASRAGTHGVLVDVTKCIGCRKCEWACNQANDLPERPLSDFESPDVFTDHRRPTESSFTVVNRWEEPSVSEGAVWTKVQCMHCNDPACVSACVVSAFSKREDGAVIYDPWRCMGCRYCMVACPFQVPAYEYHDALTPRVRKCELCRHREDESEPPACVAICPVECLTYGPRERLLEIAHSKIRNHPDQYHDHVFGEHEVGGTAWLYIAGRDMTELGLPALSDEAPPRLTETIQHGVFKNFIPPIALYGLLGQAMWMTGRKRNVDDGEVDDE